MQHEYFELSDRINWGPANAVTDAHNRDVSLYDRLSRSFFFFVSDLIPAEFPTRPGTVTLCTTTLRYIGEGCRIYTRNPRIERGPRGAPVTALFRVSELVMIVIARIIAEKLRAFLFEIASLCIPNPDCRISILGKRILKFTSR